MELRHLRVFVALAESLHFGRAAERLGTSQPAVSRSLASLEADLGAQLVDRSSRSVTLTRAGAAFLQGAEETLVAAERATLAARAGHIDGIKRLHLGLVISAMQPPLGVLLAAFRQAHPATRLVLSSTDERDLGEALARREVDAVVAWDASVPSGLNTQDIAVVPLRLLVPEGHPLRGLKSVGFDDLREHPVILPARERQPVLFERYRQITEAAGFSPRVAADVATTMDLLELVRAGVGVGFSPLPKGLRYEGVCVIDMAAPLMLTYQLAWSTRSPAVAALQRCIVDPRRSDPALKG